MVGGGELGWEVLGPGAKVVGPGTLALQGGFAGLGPWCFTSFSYSSKSQTKKKKKKKIQSDRK